MVSLSLQLPHIAAYFTDLDYAHSQGPMTPIVGTIHQKDFLVVDSRNIFVRPHIFCTTTNMTFFQQISDDYSPNSIRLTWELWKFLVVS
jgi:hypothetical protein